MGAGFSSASATRRSGPASAQQHSGSSSGRAPARRRESLSSTQTQWTRSEALLGLSLQAHTKLPAPAQRCLSDADIPGMIFICSSGVTHTPSRARSILVLKPGHQKH